MVPRNFIPTSPDSLNDDFTQYKAGFVDGYLDGIGPLLALPHVMSLALLLPGRLASRFLPFNCSNAAWTLGCRAVIQASTSPFSNHPQSTHYVAPITMSGRRQSSTASPKPISHPRPSSSVVLLSPSNQVLLLHRVQTSTSFASAHVFPGGNLDPYHDGAVPDVDSPGRHEDGEAYRLGAIRECFEETGILLAKAKNGGDDLIALPSEEIQAARKKIHSNQIKFGDWLESINAVPDTCAYITLLRCNIHNINMLRFLANLRPFTRWITPTNVPKRFTTQMYLYMLPLASNLPSEMLVPTPDGGVEHTAAVFAPAQHFLSLAASKDIILFPPQAFLLVLLTRFIAAASEASLEEYTSQRERLLSFLQQVPTAETAKGREHPTSRISWADKVMSPHNLFIRASDGRIVLGIDKPGPELKGTTRGGDWERVVLVRFTKAGPTEVEIRLRQDVLEEERQAKGGGNKL